MPKLPVWATRTLIGIGAVLGVVVVAAVLFVVFFPKDLAVAEMERRIEDATDRQLEIGGEVKLSFWPALGFSAEQTTLSNPEGFDAGTPFLSAERIVFAVAVMPLLSGNVEVKQLIFEGASLNLEAREGGAVNWTFPTEETPEDQTTLEDLRLDEMRLSDSTITFKDAASAEPLVLSDVDADMALTSLDEPAHINAAFDYRGERMDVQSDIALPRAVLEQGQTPFTAEARARPLTASFDGTFNAVNGALTGALNANGSSLRSLLAWMGSPMDEGGGFGAFRIGAQMAHEGDTTNLNEATLRLDDIEAQGRLALVTQESGRLGVTGALNAPSIDLNTYLPAPAQSGQEGVDVDTAWSSAPLDLTGLRAFDADIALAVGTLKFQRMTFSNVAMGLRVANGGLDARLTRIGLYSGAGSARLIADGAGNTPRVAFELDAQNVQAEPLLTDAIGFNRITGRGRLTASLAGQGASQAAIMRSLDGRASFNFNDGAFKGINLAQVARSIQATLAGTAVGPNAETDFAELSTTLTVSDGVAATDNLRMLNPFVRLDGQGLIDIGGQSIDMRLAPRAVRAAEGQGGDAAVQGLGIPFRVSGPWSRVSFAPAVGDLVRNELQQRAQAVLAGQQPGSPLSMLGEALFGHAPPPATPEELPEDQQADAPAPQADTPAQPQQPQTVADQPAQQTTQQPEEQKQRSPTDIFGDILRNAQKQREQPAQQDEQPSEPAPATP